MQYTLAIPAPAATLHLSLASLPTEHSVNERGGGGGGGSNGPDSWMYWKPQRQLLATGVCVCVSPQTTTPKSMLLPAS
jgi:hypothetical protein